MKRFMLRVAYDGTEFCGYQRQPNLPTIEGCVDEAVNKVLGEDILTIGASRTDSGVHAYGNVAIFDAETSIPAERLALALNTKLPETIRIIESTEVSPEFHPRKNVLDKTYEYRIFTGEILFPTDRLYYYHQKRKLDSAKMSMAARFIEGTHDFTSFCSAKAEKEDKVRTVYEIKINENGDNITISVRGSGFLYNMVRIIAGTLIKVGEGRIAPEEIPTILKNKNRNHLGTTLPAKGLFLIGIRYKN